MDYLIDFLECEEIGKTHIFSHLKCTEEEALLLRYLANRHVKGSEENSVYEMLSELFETEGYDYLKKLPLVKNLLELGWITQSSFSQIKIGEVTHLELINTSVSLSSSFIKLAEKGTLEMVLPEATAYSDHLEYLRDQFERIELYRKISALRHSFAKSSPNITRLQSRLQKLENRIDERIKATKIALSVETLFKDYHLSQKEQIIFLALLKEEYSGELESLREMNTLIDLISENEYEKIKNRSLLEEGATLIEEEIIDYDEMLTSFGGVTRSFFVTEEFLRGIIHPHKTKKKKVLKLDTLVKEQDIFELIAPKTDIEDVVLHPKTRELLGTILRQMDKNVLKLLKSWGIREKKSGLDARMIFYGPPGTGKTMTALSLAKSLKRKVLSFDCSKILSMYVGESEKNVRKIFDTYRELSEKSKSDPVLLLNEADQFLSARTTGGGGSADKMHNQMQNIFLEQIERFEGILIATTNLLESIDPAFSRRFDYKIEFAKPSFAQRIVLWEKMLPKEAVYEEGFDPKTLAKYELSGGQIKVVIKNTALEVAVKEKPVFTIKEFENAIKRELSGAFGESKPMGFM
ncbi:MAG: AAA family ATPase [Campylobacteraceae bacterium 4484_4]|nr:MAG: AAA family ATPase [Campylobacteraceae bacterium 4484_4]